MAGAASLFISGRRAGLWAKSPRYCARMAKRNPPRKPFLLTPRLVPRNVRQSKSANLGHSTVRPPEK